MALDTLTTSIEGNISWTAQKNITGRSPLIQSDALRKSRAIGTAAASNAVGGANEVASYNITVGAGSTATVDVTALTDIVQQTVNFARIKGYHITLLSYTDDATLGTNCSQVTIGNAAANQQNLNLGVNSTMSLFNGDTQCYFTSKAAGILASGSAKNILITNNDNTNAATVQFSIIGATN